MLCGMRPAGTLTIKALAVMACALAGVPLGVRAQSIEEKAQICMACHGENGVPAEQVPVIWGQNLGYLFFQLRDFKSGARRDEQMTPIAEALEDGDLMALAQYFCKKPWPRLQQPEPPPHVAAAARQASASVFCTSCHYEGFKGDSAQPRLAGQARGYLQRTMSHFRSGTRSNNPGMTGLMKSLTDDDIAAMAAWLSSM